MKRVLIAGLIAGAIDPLAVMVLHASGSLREGGAGFGLLFVPLIQIAIIVVAIARRGKDVDAGKAAPGYLPALGAGLGMTLLAATLSWIGTYVFTTMIDTTYLGWLLEQQQSALTEQAMPKEMRDAQMAALERWSTPGMYALRNALSTGMVGGLASLVGGAVFKGRASR